jgi:hypothetical protein
MQESHQGDKMQEPRQGDKMQLSNGILTIEVIFSNPTRKQFDQLS